MFGYYNRQEESGHSIDSVPGEEDDTKTTLSAGTTKPEAMFEDQGPAVVTCQKPSSRTVCSMMHGLSEQDDSDRGIPRNGFGSSEIALASRSSARSNPNMKEKVLPQENTEKIMHHIASTRSLASKDDNRDKESEKTFDSNDDDNEVGREAGATGSTNVGSPTSTFICTISTVPSIIATANVTTATTTNPISTNDDSVTTSAITMNRYNKGEALDRLLNDLTQDEVSMMVSIFGGGSNLDREPSIGLRNWSAQDEPNGCCEEKVNKTGVDESGSVPVSIPIARLEEPVSRSRIPEDFLSRETGGAETPQTSWRTFYPVVDPQEFCSSGVAEANGDTAFTVPRPSDPRGTILANASLIIDQAWNIICHEPALIQTESLASGAGLSATPTKEQQMVPKQCEKVICPLKPPPQPLMPLQAKEKTNPFSTFNHCDGSCTPSLVLLSRKRAYDSCEGIARATRAIGVGVGVAASAAKRTKASPVAKKLIATKSRNNKGDTTTPTITYIKHPKNLDENRWNDRLKESYCFVVKHGHGRIPTKYPPNQELASWAKRQRYHYKLYKKHVLDRQQTPGVPCAETLPPGGTGKKPPRIRFVKCLMTAKRLSKLEAIGFCMDLQAGCWERNYALLSEYAKRNNGRTSPSKHTHYDLWKWVGTQRYQMTLWKRKKKNGTPSSNTTMSCLTPERISKLREISFAWDDKSATEANTK